MIYNYNYRRQIFWDTNDSLTVMELIQKITDLATINRESPPSSKDSKTFGIGCLLAFILGGAAGSITYLINKSAAGAIVIGMISFFMVFTVTAFIILRNRMLVRPAKMTQEVNAECIGFSFTCSNGHRLRTPVFAYHYNGKKYLSYDGTYANNVKMPAIGSEVTIHIDPDDPNEIMWSEKNNKNTFIFGALVCAIMFIGEIGFIILALNDKGIMG